MYRKYDAKLKTHILTIFAGEIYISSDREIISTVLGSCISVCLYDREKGIGGMNHFMLPQGGHGELYDRNGLRREKLTEESMRYGITAMEVLIGRMQKEGAERANLRAKIFGGARIIKGTSDGTAVGDKNINFSRAYLKSEGIPLDGEDVGDTYGRKIFFLTGRNSVFVKKVALAPAVEKEREYLKELREQKKKTDVTIF